MAEWTEQGGEACMVRMEASRQDLASNPRQNIRVGFLPRQLKIPMIRGWLDLTQGIKVLLESSVHTITPLLLALTL